MATYLVDVTVEVEAEDSEQAWELVNETASVINDRFDIAICVTRVGEPEPK